LPGTNTVSLFNVAANYCLHNQSRNTSCCSS